MSESLRPWYTGYQTGSRVVKPVRETLCTVPSVGVSRQSIDVLQTLAFHTPLKIVFTGYNDGKAVTDVSNVAIHR
ncbi:hypothetical protein GUJ98_16185 [Enterococcus durans]|nr:hypothetical protein [Enterococcus durans]